MRKLSDAQAIIFDLDGTLTDSGPGIMKAAALTLAQLGVPCEDSERLREFVGPPLSHTFQKFGIPKERVDDAIAIYRIHYHQGGLKFDNSPYPGIDQLLRTLHEAGKKLYVGTSKPEALSIEILHRFGLDIWFDKIAGATLDHTRENKNDVLRYLLNSLEPGISAVMVGDTVYDVLGAKDLQLPCIGVTWGYGSVPSMQETGAVAIADSMDELKNLLLSGTGDGSCVPCQAK